MAISDEDKKEIRLLVIKELQDINGKILVDLGKQRGISDEKSDVEILSLMINKFLSTRHGDIFDGKNEG